MRDFNHERQEQQQGAEPTGFLGDPTSQPDGQVKCPDQREHKHEELGSVRRRSHQSEEWRFQEVKDGRIRYGIDDGIARVITQRVPLRIKGETREVILPEYAIRYMSGGISLKPEAIIVPVQTDKIDPGQENEPDLKKKTSPQSRNIQSLAWSLGRHATSSPKGFILSQRPSSRVL